MLMKLSVFISRYAIKRALKRAAPDTIPLTGIERLRRRNFYIVWLVDKGADTEFKVESIDTKGVAGYWATTGGAGNYTSIASKDIPHFDIKITHYAQELELKYESLIQFVWGTISFKAARSILKRRFRVWAYSQKKLSRHDRLEVLTWAYEWTLGQDPTNANFTPVGFLIHRHGHLILEHPELNQQKRYYQIVFKSLVESGDLIESSAGQFSLAPKSLATLDHYEESDRRHNDNLRQQSRLGWLTFALVLIGVGQIVTAFLKE